MPAADPTNEALADGFVLALNVIDSMGVKYDMEKVAENLRLVASGDLSLLGSPEDEITEMGRRMGSPATEQEIVAYREYIKQNRTSANCANAAMALVVLHLLFPLGGKP